VTSWEKNQAMPKVSDAQIWVRVFAAFLDVVFLYITLVSIGGFTVWVIPHPRANWMFNLIAAPLLSWLYFALMESSGTQASFGKQLLRLRVTGLAGERLDFRRASLRFWGGAVTLFAGLLLAAFTARRQSLHDWVSGSLVMRLEPSE